MLCLHLIESNFLKRLSAFFAVLKKAGLIYPTPLVQSNASILEVILDGIYENPISAPIIVPTIALFVSVSPPWKQVSLIAVS